MRRAEAQSRYTLIESDDESDLSAFAEEVERGLTESPKHLPCRFFYDAEGSALFEAICGLPEYYLTRAENEILSARSGEIAGHFSGPIALAELGSGSSTKTRSLIEAFLRRHGALRYVPVDVSRSMLESSALALLERYAGLEVRAIASEYAEGLRHVQAETDRPKLIAWLGSSIGNFERDEAARFLRRVRAAMAPRDRMLIGVDLRKAPDVLERAYDDAQGVTARFNLNLLERINRELSGHFDCSSFGHRAVYDQEMGRVSMFLVSERAQRVAIDDLGLEVDFGAGEAIHTESSYKYSAREIDELATRADLAVQHSWRDADQHFSLNLLAPRS
ncbi:MAG: L-histidine N(alpha)-methyltransferase [Myxococcota bacterium]